MKKFLIVLGLVLFGLGYSSSTASARGGNVTPNNVCSPISSLSVKGDGRVGELGTASVQMSWSVKPCDKSQSVRVITEVLNWNTKALIYKDENSLLSGKVTVFVPGRQLYQARVTVVDSITGDVLGTQSYVVSTTPKGV